MIFARGRSLFNVLCETEVRFTPDFQAAGAYEISKCVSVSP